MNELKEKFEKHKWARNHILALARAETNDGLHPHCKLAILPSISQWQWLGPRYVLRNLIYACHGLTDVLQ